MKLLNLDGELIHEDTESKTTKELVASAIKAGKSLARADLTRADLARADLTRADLAGADLTGADLARADLARAYLTGADLARAYLAGAYLTDAYLAGAYLAGADLAGADLARAYLAGAYLAGADLTDAYLAGAYLAGAIGVEDAPPAKELPETPVIPRIHSTLLEAVKRTGCKLDMSQWHQCETTHCRAGWVVTLAGEAGAKLEKEVGTARAAAMIYRKSDPGCRVPHWYATNERAMKDIERCAREEAEKAATP